MTPTEIEKWERYGQEAAQRDFEMKIYNECEQEDTRRENPETEKRFRVTYSIEVSAPTTRIAEALAWSRVAEGDADAEVEEITPATGLIQIGGIDGL